MNTIVSVLTAVATWRTEEGQEKAEKLRQETKNPAKHTYLSEDGVASVAFSDSRSKNCPLWDSTHQSAP